MASTANMTRQELLAVLQKYMKKVVKSKETIASKDALILEQKETVADLERRLLIMSNDLKKRADIAVAPVSVPVAPSPNPQAPQDSDSAESPKLDEAHAQLSKAFKLLKEEKASHSANVSQLRSDLELAGKTLNAERTKHAKLLKTQQTILASKSSANQQLHEEINELNAKLLAFEAERDEVARRERLIAVSMEESRNLRNTLERERQIREQEKSQRLVELDIEREERIRGKDDYERERTKLTRERDQATEALAAYQEHAAKEVKDLEERYNTLLDERGRIQAELNKEKKISQSRANELLSLTKHQSRLQDGIEQEAQVKVDEEKAKLAQMEKRLEEAKAVHEEHVRDLQQQLEQSKQQLATLQEQVDNGHPEERRILELAQLQARRDDSVRNVHDQIAKLNLQLQECRTQIALDAEAKNHLQKEVKSLVRSDKRSELNVDYLKNVILQYMLFGDDRKQSDALIPALARLLHFSPDDMKAITEMQRNRTDEKGGWLGMFGKE